MSYNTSNWKEKLEEVRGHVRANAELNEQAPIEEVVVEKTVDEKINDQIEEALANAFEELGLTDVSRGLPGSLKFEDDARSVRILILIVRSSR